jgi:hypothetical protein
MFFTLLLTDPFRKVDHVNRYVYPCSTSATGKCDVASFIRFLNHSVECWRRGGRKGPLKQGGFELTAGEFVLAHEISLSAGIAPTPFAERLDRGT